MPRLVHECIQVCPCISAGPKVCPSARNHRYAHAQAPGPTGMPSQRIVTPGIRPYMYAQCHLWQYTAYECALALPLPSHQSWVALGRRYLCNQTQRSHVSVASLPQLLALLLIPGIRPPYARCECMGRQRTTRRETERDVQDDTSLTRPILEWPLEPTMTKTLGCTMTIASSASLGEKT